jgi:hypothetical protein
MQILLEDAPVVEKEYALLVEARVFRLRLYLKYDQSVRHVTIEARDVGVQERYCLDCNGVADMFSWSIRCYVGPAGFVQKQVHLLPPIRAISSQKIRNITSDDAKV